MYKTIIKGIIAVIIVMVLLGIAGQMDMENAQHEEVSRTQVELNY